MSNSSVLEVKTPADDSSLHDPKIVSVLQRLHAQADHQKSAFLKPVMAMGVDKILGRKPSVEEEAARFKELFIPLSPESGKFAYLTARSIGARRIVEFGTSFGISTIYLAAAVRDNGGGIVIGSEIEPGKIAQAKENIAAAGLSDYVEIRPGDAQQSLRDPGGPVDLILLDGWKDLYLPMLKILAPRLRPNAVVLADNIKTFPKALAPYVAFVQNARNGFDSVTLPLGAGIEYSVKL
jgi:predicted O-methyltransferase YrrM